MSDVKPVIAFLCKHLKLLYNIDIKAEHFRLAKFNKTDNNCVSQMWNLLQKLCHEIRQPWLNIENPILYVKLHFMALGYNGLEFYCLPMDKSAGSRELLLAFGWMLLTQDMLEKSAMKTLQMSPLNMEFDPKVLQQNGEMENSEPAKEYVRNKASLENKLSFILWCAGKIRYNIKTIQDLGDTRIQRAHMIHKSTIETCGLPHLSALETHLIRCPERVPEFVNEVKKCSEVTDSHLLWLKKMHIFWEWMESVVAEKKVNRCHTGFHLEGNNHKVLSQLLAAARSHIKHYLLYCDKENGKTIRPRAQNNYLSYDGNSRYIYSSKDTESEMTDILSDSELQLQELEKLCLIKKEKLLSKLQQAQEQMKNILVVSSEF